MSERSDKQLQYALLQYLKGLKEASSDSGDQENLDVAMDCLR